MAVALLGKRIAILGPILRWAPTLSQSAAESFKDVQLHGVLTREKTLGRIKMGNRKGVEDILEPAIEQFREGHMTEEQLADQAYM